MDAQNCEALIRDTEEPYGVSFNADTTARVCRCIGMAEIAEEADVFPPRGRASGQVHRDVCGS